MLVFLAERKLLRPADIRTPAKASIEELLRFHDRRYVESLDEAESMALIFGTCLSPPAARQVLRFQRLATGATIDALRTAVRGGGTALNLSGGFHHATADSGGGFCVFNDIAVAIRSIRTEGFEGRVLVVDLDLHDGNGTRDAFRADDSVFTLSVHNRHWDDTRAVESAAIELGDDVEDGPYLDTVARVLPGIVSDFNPEAALYLAGADPARDDPLGNWRISEDGIFERDRFVLDTLRELKPGMPVVILAGGGYGLGAWRYTARLLAWLGSGKDVRPPPKQRTDLMFAKRLRDREARKGVGDLWNWSLTEEDLGLLAPDQAVESRFLGHFSRFGLELLFEQAGVFQRLRSIGYTNPMLDIDTSSPLGHTIRMYGDGTRQDLLMEWRIRRDRRAVPGMEVLYVEWLLLQNPKARFTESAPALPGQQYPGLGLLGTIASISRFICRELKLDGVMFIPSQYYMAAIASHYLCFLDPEGEAWFNALQDFLGNYTLAEASALIAGGKVLDEKTRTPVQWRVVKLILPVSRRMKRMVAVERRRAGPVERPSFVLA